MSERSREVIEGALSTLADQEAVEQHPEYDAAIAVLASLMDVPAFQRAWLLMGKQERTEMTSTLADGIEARVERREREILVRLATVL